MDLWARGQSHILHGSTVTTMAAPPSRRQGVAAVDLAPTVEAAAAASKTRPAEEWSGLCPCSSDRASPTAGVSATGWTFWRRHGCPPSQRRWPPTAQASTPSYDGTSRCTSTLEPPSRCRPCNSPTSSGLTWGFAPLQAQRRSGPSSPSSEVTPSWALQEAPPRPLSITATAEPSRPNTGPAEEEAATTETTTVSSLATTT